MSLRSLAKDLATLGVGSPFLAENPDLANTAKYINQDAAQGDLQTGGVTLVEYTVTADEVGYGVVPEETVADMTALLAYTPLTNHSWVEVTVSDHSLADARLYCWNGGPWVGPFPLWFKNDKYIIGQNDETRLFIPDLNRQDNTPDGVTFDALDDNTKLTVRSECSIHPVFTPTSIANNIDVVALSTDYSDKAGVFHKYSSRYAQNGGTRFYFGIDANANEWHNRPTILSPFTKMEIISINDSPVAVSSNSNTLFGIPLDLAPEGADRVLVTRVNQGVTHWDYTNLNPNFSNLSGLDYTDAASLGYSVCVYDSLTGYMMSKNPLFPPFRQLNAASGAEVDLSMGQVFTLTSPGTVTFINPPSSGSFTFTLQIYNAGATTWPASVKWPNNTPPSMSTTGIDIVEFTKLEGTYYGRVIGLGYSL